MSVENPNKPYEFPENSDELIAQVLTPSIDTDPEPGTAARGTPDGDVVPYDPYRGSQDLGGSCPHCGAQMETFVRASYESPGSVSLVVFGQCLRTCGYRPIGELAEADVSEGA